MKSPTGCIRSQKHERGHLAAIVSEKSYRLKADSWGTLPFVPKGARSMTPKEIRLAAGLSIERAAVAAGVTSPTIRLFEASPDAAPRARAKLETFYARLATKAAQQPVEGPRAA